MNISFETAFFIIKATLIKIDMTINPIIKKFEVSLETLNSIKHIKPNIIRFITSVPNSTINAKILLNVFRYSY